MGPLLFFLGSVPQGYVAHKHLRVRLAPRLISLDPGTIVESYSVQVFLVS